MHLFGRWHCDLWQTFLFSKHFRPVTTYNTTNMACCWCGLLWCGFTEVELYLGTVSHTSLMACASGQSSCAYYYCCIESRGWVVDVLLQDIKFPLSLDIFDLCTPELQQRLVPVRDKFKEEEDKRVEAAQAVKSDIWICLTITRDGILSACQLQSQKRPVTSSHRNDLFYIAHISIWQLHEMASWALATSSHRNDLFYIAHISICCIGINCIRN